MGPQKIEVFSFSNGRILAIHDLCFGGTLAEDGGQPLVGRCRVMSWNRNSFDSRGHGTDGQASSWLANRPGKFWRCFMLKKSGKILRRFIHATSEGLFACGWSSRLWSCCDFQHAIRLPRCCWATTSCEASVLCTRRFHTENSLKLPSYVSTSSFCGCQNMHLCHTTSISKNMDPGLSLRRCREPRCLEVAGSTIVSHNLCASPIVRHVDFYGLG